MIPTLLTIKRLCEKHEICKYGGVRYHILNKATNGLEESGAIVRVGRKIFIDESKYFAWMQAPKQGSVNLNCETGKRA